jgi:hypothetical protein
VSRAWWLLVGGSLVLTTWWLWPRGEEPSPLAARPPAVGAPELTVQPAKPVSKPADVSASGATRSTPRPTMTAAQQQAWKQFGNFYKEKYSVVHHRAAVTGNLVDAAAAAAQRRWCMQGGLPESFYGASGIELPEHQLRLVRQANELCADGKVSLQKTIKDAVGFTGDVEQFMNAAAGHGHIKPEATQQILDFVKQTRSASLLEAMPYTVLLKALYESGLPPPDSPLPKELDGGLLLPVLQLKGCEERGDCAGVGSFSPRCSQDNSCVNDYRDFAATRIYGDLSTRAHGYHPQLTGGASAAQLRRRYEQIQHAVTVLFF